MPEWERERRKGRQHAAAQAEFTHTGWLHSGCLACCVASGQLLNLSDSQLISYTMRLLTTFPAYILLFMPVKE